MKTILGVAVLWMLFCCAAGAQDNLVTAQNPPNGNVRSADRHQAPIGHRQPRQQDLPSDVRRREGTGSAMHGISTDSSTFVAAAEILHSNYAQAATCARALLPRVPHATAERRTMWYAND